jgi:hypothetical protein
MQTMQTLLCLGCVVLIAAALPLLAMVAAHLILGKSNTGHWID